MCRHVFVRRPIPSGGGPTGRMPSAGLPPLTTGSVLRTPVWGDAWFIGVSPIRVEDRWMFSETGCLMCSRALDQRVVAQKHTSGPTRPPPAYSTPTGLPTRPPDPQPPTPYAQLAHHRRATRPFWSKSGPKIAELRVKRRRVARMPVAVAQFKVVGAPHMDWSEIVRGLRHSGGDSRFPAFDSSRETRARDASLL